MDGFFEYPYRWQQILIQTDVSTQIQMLEERDRALEDFFYRGGKCPLELPFRWDQIWPGVAAGEAWAVACAEENDRAIEALFANCSCSVEGLTGDGPIESEMLYRADFGFFGSSTSLTSVHIEATNLVIVAPPTPGHLEINNTIIAGALLTHDFTSDAPSLVLDLPLTGDYFVSNYNFTIAGITADNFKVTLVETGRPPETQPWILV